MPRLLTVGMLIALLWPWAAPSDAQAQGPGPREVPSELWEEYPLKEPRSTPREETRERRGDQHRPAPRASDRVTSDGSNATTAFLIGGLLLLTASAVLLFARASVRDKKRALRGGAPAADVDVPSTAQSTRRPSVPRPRPPTESTRWARPAPDRDARAPASPGGQPALGYASVPEGSHGNDSMRRQQQEIEAICGRKDLALLKLVRDVERLTRSAANIGTLVEWLDVRGVRLVVVDIDLDTGTPEGRLVAKALAAVGGSERKTLMQRTRKGLEAARLAQRFSGRLAVSDASALKQRIAEMRAGGMTLQAIADTLNSEGVPTLRGGALWRPSSVQAATGYKRPKRASPLA
jgi:hypothetical protein